jgi:hypothetical protein
VSGKEEGLKLSWIRHTSKWRLSSTVAFIGVGVAVDDVVVVVVGVANAAVLDLAM